MKEREQNIEIAKLRGWKVVGYGNLSGIEIDLVLDDPDGIRCFGSAFLPHYTSDLNSIQLAIRDLPEDEFDEFVDLLADMIACRNRVQMTDAYYLAVKATALELCEAFLNLKGKWCNNPLTP